jgi:DNA modification methylase
MIAEAKAEGKKWTQDQTGERLGLKQNTVSTYLAISEELDRGHLENNEKILNAAELSTAYKIVNTIKERRSALTSFGTNGGEKSKTVINADFCKWAPSYTGPKFNFIHCDFPYGTGADQIHQGGSVAVHGAYDDSPEIYWTLLKALCDNLNRICAESAHIIFWFSMHHYHETLEYFAKYSDFEIEPFPLIWTKSDPKGVASDWQHRPRRIYETCLFGWRGGREIINLKSNSYSCPTDRQHHMSTKPERVLREFFKMIVDENTIMLDPTCGSGTALRAAESLGAAHILGIEKDPKFVERATLALEEARRARLKRGATADSTQLDSGADVWES